MPRAPLGEINRPVNKIPDHDGARWSRPAASRLTHSKEGGRAT